MTGEGMKVNQVKFLIFYLVKIKECSLMKKLKRLQKA